MASCQGFGVLSSPEVILAVVRPFQQKIITHRPIERHATEWYVRTLNAPLCLHVASPCCTIPTEIDVHRLHDIEKELVYEVTKDTLIIDIIRIDRNLAGLLMGTVALCRLYDGKQ